MTTIKTLKENTKYWKMLPACTLMVIQQDKDVQDIIKNGDGELYIEPHQARNAHLNDGIHPIERSMSVHERVRTVHLNTLFLLACIKDLHDALDDSIKGKYENPDPR